MTAVGIDTREAEKAQKDIDAARRVYDEIHRSLTGSQRATLVKIIDRLERLVNRD